MTDAFGNPIELDDHIGTITSARWSDVVKGRVIQLGKNQVKVVVLHSSRHPALVGGTKWIPCDRAMKVVK